MSHLRPLREELLKYQNRKRRSLDGSIPGIPHESFLRITTPGIKSPRPDRGHFQNDLYLGDIPSQYRPNMFSPAVDWEEYRQDQDEFIAIPKTPQTPPLFNHSIPEPPMLAAPSDELSLTEQWLMNIGARPRPQESSIPVEFGNIQHLVEGVRTSLDTLDSHLQSSSKEAIPFENSIFGNLQGSQVNETHMLPNIEQLAEALWILKNNLPADHPDILNLKQAQLQLGRKQLSEMEQDSGLEEQYERINENWQSNLGTGNPYENDDLATIQADILQEPLLPPCEDLLLQEAELEQHLQTDEITDPSLTAESVETEPVLDALVDQEYEQLPYQAGGIDIVEPDALQGPSMEAANHGQPKQLMGLEANAAFDEINQAIDQAAAFEQPQMDPWKMQDHLYMQMDMQMQYMANPFMAPGPMMGPM